MIDPDHNRLSIRRQCELVSISRASFYRQPAGENPENLELMRVIDAAFMETVARVDARVLVLAGLAISAWSLWIMAGFDVAMQQGPIMISGLLQGLGLGLVFVPLSTLAFATPRPEHRVDATAIFSLVRNVGSGIGISLVTTVLAQMSQVNHAELAERVTMNAPQIRDFLSGGNAGMLISRLNGLVNQQSAMLAYLDDFFLMMVVALVSAPIVLLLRNPGTTAKRDPAHAMEE